MASSSLSISQPEIPQSTGPIHQESLADFYGDGCRGWLRGKWVAMSLGEEVLNRWSSMLVRLTLGDMTL
jgi:hypothetical protein